MAESLRDQLSAVYDTVVPDGGEAAPVSTPEPAPAPESPPSSRIVAAPEKVAPAVSTPGDDRPRGPDGKFVQKEEAKPSAPAAKEEVKTAAKVHKAPAAPAATPPGSPQAEAALPAVPAKPRPPRPSSWKKEFWDQWETLDPALAEYLNTRESQFASGVSAYKAEADAAKPIVEAMQPFMEELKQHNLNPSTWVTELGHVHRIMALGAPAQKLQTLARVAQAYGVPLQALYDQQAQQQYLAQGQYQQPLAAPQVPQGQRPLTADEANKLFEDRFVQVDSERELQRFAADTEKHPHYEEVRNTMAQLLDANLATDLESAYTKALRMPEYEHLVQAEREQQRVAQDEARRKAEADRVLKAKGKAVSPASATPSGPGSEEKPKGLRSAIAGAFDQHVGGRV